MKIKKIVKFLLSGMLLLTAVINKHVHDEDCGYDPTTDTGCIYDIQPHETFPPDEEDPLN